MSFDYGEFHPLTHRIGSRECFRWYGGPWRHADLRWEYSVHPWIMSNTRCRFGRHVPIEVYLGRRTPEDLYTSDPDRYECRDCMKELSPGR